MALSIYTRGKNEAGRWRYGRIKEGRGKKTGEFVAPFFIRPMVEGKQIWKPLVAENFSDARLEADRMIAGLEARAQGLTVAQFRDNGDRLPLAKAVHDFILEAASKKKPKTLIGYKLNLRQFLESTKSIYFLDEVTKHTIRQFRDYLLAKGYEPRTLHNRVMTVLSLLKEHKVQTGFSLASDLHTFEEESPVAFTDEHLKKLFANMDAEDTARYKSILGTAPVSRKHSMPRGPILTKACHPSRKLHPPRNEFLTQQRSMCCISNSELKSLWRNNGLHQSWQDRT